MLIVLAGMGYIFTRQKPKPTVNKSVVNTIKPKSDNYRVAYSVFIHDIKTPERGYPVYEYWYQDSSKQPVKIGEFGSDKNYIYVDESVLSPNGESLFLRYDDRIDVVDLTSKQVSTVWKPEAGFNPFGFALNPTGTEIIISSANLQSKPTKVTIDKITLKDKQKMQLLKSVYEFPFAPVRWRDDNKVLVQIIPQSEFTGYATFDLATNKIAPSEPTHTERHVSSKDGKAVAYPAGSIDDPCNTFSGSSTSKWEIAEPTANKILGTFGDSTKSVGGIIAKDDGSEFLYESTPIPAVKSYDEAACNPSPAKPGNFYVYNVSTKATRQVANYKEAYQQWYPGRPYTNSEMDGTQCQVELLDNLILKKVCDQSRQPYLIVGLSKLD